MPRMPRVSSASESDSNDDTDSSVSDVPARRSSSSDSASEESEEDVRKDYLVDSFKEKDVKTIISTFIKKELRRRFLGQPVVKEEKRGLVENYYCSPSDFKLFSAPTIHDSPLAMLQHASSTLMLDLQRTHGDLLFSLRIGLLSYERTLDLRAKWAGEKTHAITGKVSPPGPWLCLDYKYKDVDPPLPVPWKLRPAVSTDSVKELLARDFISNAATPEDKLDALCRWALSYKEGFDRQKVLLDEVHSYAIGFHDAMSTVRKDVEVLSQDTGNSLRLLGWACQQIKGIREASYTEALDGSFRRFLDSSKKAKSPEEKMRLRAGALVDEDIAKQAKNYTKLRKAMDSVSSTKRKKVTSKILAQAKKKRAEEDKKHSCQRKAGSGSGFKKKQNKKSAKAGNNAGKKRRKGKADKSAKKDGGCADSE